jgi:hypothetical protein
MEDVSPHPRRLVARRDAGGCGGRDGGHAWCGGAGEGGHIGFAPWGEPPLDVGGAVGLVQDLGGKAAESVHRSESFFSLFVLGFKIFKIFRLTSDVSGLVCRFVSGLVCRFVSELMCRYTPGEEQGVGFAIVIAQKWSLSNLRDAG